MDKVGLMLNAAAVVFTGGVMLWAAPATWRAAKRGAVAAGGWVNDTAAALADWIDRAVERVGSSVNRFIDDDRIDWDAAAANAGAVEVARGQCPECFGQPGSNLRAENALLRANAAAGRAELQTLRHQVAMLNDTISAADRRIADVTAGAVESAREVERLLRERAMAPKRRDAALGRAPRAVPGAAMGDA